MVVDMGAVSSIQRAVKESNHKEVCALRKQRYKTKEAQQWINEILHGPSPTVLMDLCDLTDLHLLQDILNLNCIQDKALWVDTCLRHLHPRQLDFELVEVDFWNGVLLQKGSFHLHISWASWIPLFLEHLMQSGCSRPKRWHWLPNSYCIADPDHVNLSLESIHLWKLYLFSPDSLLQCCRKVTRNSMKSLHTFAFDQLPLPKSLVRYCRLDDM